MPPAVSRPLTVFAALFDNGRFLGLKCSIVVPAKSQPLLSPELVPLSLHPTDLQQSMIHHLWIDRFPFPRFRDDMIQLSGVIDEEEFIADLFELESFEIVAGGAGWDPGAWRLKAGTVFTERWGWLFC